MHGLPFLSTLTWYQLRRNDPSLIPELQDYYDGTQPWLPTRDVHIGKQEIKPNGAEHKLSSQYLPMRRFKRSRCGKKGASPLAR